MGTKGAANIWVFVDEVTQLPSSTSSNSNHIWLGAAYAKQENLPKIIKQLLSARYDVFKWQEAKNLTSEKGYYKKNNEEVKSTKIGSRANTYHIADRWIRLVKWSNFFDEDLKFKLTGINISDIDQSKFGDPSQVDTRSRVFSKVLKGQTRGCIKKLFPRYDHYSVNFVHDRGNQERASKFEQILGSFEEDYISMGNLNFIDSNHKSHEKGSQDWYSSHLIQLVDLFVGARARYGSTHEYGEKWQKIFGDLEQLENLSTYENPLHNSYSVTRSWP